MSVRHEDSGNPTPNTPVEKNELPRTGSGSSKLALLSLAALVAGGVSVAASRRRRLNS